MKDFNSTTTQRNGTERAESRTFRLSAHLYVEITVGMCGMTCEWSPRLPSKLKAGELRRYRRARGEMLHRLAESTGCKVLCVEL